MDFQSFYAGTAKVDITPPLGTLINGDFFPHRAKIIHDPLYAKALVMEKAGTVVAIVVVDICSMSVEYVNDIKTGIVKQSGILQENILIACTHTHAAGAVVDIHLTPADINYSKRLAPLIIKAVVQASKKLKPARVAFGSVEIPDHVLCRRYFMKPGYIARNPVSGETDGVKTNPFGNEKMIDSPAATTDPEVSYLAIQGIDRKWISVLANYSLHYVGDWENGTISSDYFGEFERHIQLDLDAGTDFVGIMTNGTSGDINSWDFLHADRYPKEHYKKSKLIASEIVESITASLENIEWQADPGLFVRYAEVILGIRKPTIRELDIAKPIVEKADYNTITIDDDGLRKIYAREQILLNEYPDTISFPVHVIQIGNCLIGGLAGEFFAETGLKLKQNSPVENYFTIGLANGNRGYVPPEHEMKKGGYETWRCRASPFEQNAENIVREKLTEMLGQIK